MAAEIKLVLFQPTDIEFLAGGATLELSGYIFLVVADNPVVESTLVQE